MGKLTPIWKSVCLRQSCATLWTGCLGGWEEEKATLKKKTLHLGLFSRIKLCFHPLNKAVSLGNHVPQTYCFLLGCWEPMLWSPPFITPPAGVVPYWVSRAQVSPFPICDAWPCFAWEHDVKCMEAWLPREAVWLLQTIGCRPALWSLFCWVCLARLIPAPPFALEKLALRTNYGNAPHNELNSWLMCISIVDSCLWTILF